MENKNQNLAGQAPAATLKDYISIARPDHWFKNVFMVPGMVLAMLAYDVSLELELIYKLIVGVFSTCLIASANYTINEWLDAPFDRYHPVKKNRPSVVSALTAKNVYLQYALLAVVGLGLAWTISIPFFLCEVWLFVMGVIYNVRPMRSKDRIYIDVLSESINNPIRLMLGWYIVVDATTLTPPPTSMMLAYWMGGAFLMGIKRFAEYRFIDNPEVAGLYRKSFAKYTERKLLVSVFFYALTAAFFLGIFLIKNRIELLLSFPLFALLFAWYLHMSYTADSEVQRPEKLYKNKSFMAFVAFLVVVVFVLFFVEIPGLQWLLTKTFDFS